MKTIRRRPYQRQILNAPSVLDIVRGVVEGHGAADGLSTLVVAPTGSGKTVMFASLAEYIASRRFRVYIITHRQEILEQILSAMFDLGVTCGQISATAPVTMDPVQVGMVQTVVRRLGRLRRPDLIIVDEAHHYQVGHNEWGKVLEYWRDVPRIGFTATPELLSGVGLGASFGRMVEGPQVGDLVAQGWLATPRMLCAPLDLLTAKYHVRRGRLRYGGAGDEGPRASRHRRPNRPVSEVFQRRPVRRLCADPGGSRGVRRGVPGRRAQGAEGRGGPEIKLTHVAGELVEVGMEWDDAMDLAGLYDAAMAQGPQDRARMLARRGMALLRETRRSDESPTRTAWRARGGGESVRFYIASSWKNQHAVEMLTFHLEALDHKVDSFVREATDAEGIAKVGGLDAWINSEDGRRKFIFDTESAMKNDCVIYIGPSGPDAWAEVGAAFSCGVPILALYAKGESIGLMRRMVSKWFYHYADLLRYIEDRYGQNGKHGEKPSPLYTKSPEEADEKTAWKQLLKDVFAEAEDKAMRLALGGSIIPETGDSIKGELEPDISDRMGARLSGAMRTVTPDPEPEPEEEPEPEPAEPAGEEEKELF